jgi:hypothetical protein
MRRLEIGAVLEIPTSAGYRYAQYTHRHKRYGCLLRVFEFVSQIPATSFEFIAETTSTLPIFSFVSEAVKAGKFHIVAHAPISHAHAVFPVFRCAVHGHQPGQVLSWILWDGDHEWQVSRLSEEDAKLPLLILADPAGIVDILESRQREKAEDYAAD